MVSGYAVMFRDKGIIKSDIQNIKKKNYVQRHRGPDVHGYYINRNVMMGFRGLKVSDSEPVKQPYSYQNRYHVVYDGKIYNCIELRDMLISKEYKFDTESDTEILTALYDYMGPDMVHKLRGMFSFIIWDDLDKTIFAARDPFGIKPIYYVTHKGSLSFASEKKGLILGDENIGKIDREALHHYMSFQYVPEPICLEKGIFALKPGHTLMKKVGSILKTTKYFNVVFNVSKDGFDSKISRIRTSIEKSVEKHMISDSPVGSLLSGGIDSTIILALAKRINPNIKTFTVGFDNNGYSEIDLAKATAEELGVENISKIISPQEFVKELPKIVWHMDQPLADPSAIPLYFASKEAASHVKVLLSGEGADELFGGYNIYREPNSLKVFSYVPKSLKSILKNFAKHLPEGVKGKSFIERGCTLLEDRYIGNAKIFKDSEKSQLIRKYNKDFSPQLITKPLYEKAKNYDDVSKMQYIDIHTWLSGDMLLSADRMSMANSVEIRVPFLDKEVGDIAFGLDHRDKINCHTTKYALREAFKDVIPESAYKRRKLGFPVPIRCWLKEELYEWAKEEIARSQAGEIINKNYALELLEKHKNGKVDYSRRIWAILIFTIWYEEIQSTQ